MKKQNIYQLTHYGRIGGAPRYQDFMGVACDSRLVQAGNLFVAMKGAQTDGHQFLKEVSEKGAVAAIVHDDYSGPHYGLTLIFVHDPLDTLQQLARDLLARQHSRVIAITGSLGKTTTKEFLFTLLNGKYKVLRTPGNNNSQIGLPLALLNGLEGDEQVVICEMGMTHAGNIAKLVKIAPPYLGIITCVEPVHACNFSGIEGISQAKAEIFSHSLTSFGLLDSSVEGLKKLHQHHKPKIFTFSKENKHADFIFDIYPDGTLAIKGVNGVAAEFPPMHLPAKHNGYNFLIAAVAAYLIGMSWTEIAQRQPLLTLPERRLQFIEKKGILFVNDSYNASMVAVKAALDALPVPKKQGRTIAALGEMLELGDLTEKHHRAVGEHALTTVDEIFCLGEGCKPIEDVWKVNKKPCHLFIERNELIDALRKTVQPGDVVLVKGSRLKQMWKVIEEI
ncbi:MAG: UDP-N-acetylmuramoyl-tripeptide--D-alanyl-D-alanine ligase [Parachlamydiales bacterium]|jgi:UDP-N-acetylmuramoyl-tripeptide--D-alanyl-D-alanine ligase